VVFDPRNEGALLKPLRLLFLAAFLLSFLTPCFAHHLAVVVDKDNNVGNLTNLRLAKIFRSEIKKWPDGKDIVIILHRDAPGERLTLERLTRMSPQELKARMTARDGRITEVDADADVLKMVGSTPGAVGLVDVRQINNRVNVVKVDGKLPLEGGYLPHQ
jgi:ABC-type phosphate transport system substrate-binding protein